MSAHQEAIWPKSSQHATREGEFAYWSTLKWQEMPYEERLAEWKRHLGELGIPFDSFREQAILDVGCSPVGIVFFLDARINTGVDPLAEQYSQWNGYWGKRVNLIQAEGESMPIPDQSFDTVF